MCDAATVLRTRALLAMFFFTGFTPAQQIDNRLLVAAFAGWGARLLSREALTAKYFDEIYDV